MPFFMFAMFVEQRWKQLMNFKWNWVLSLLIDEYLYTINICHVLYMGKMVHHKQKFLSQGT